MGSLRKRIAIAVTCSMILGISSGFISSGNKVYASENSNSYSESNNIEVINGGRWEPFSIGNKFAYRYIKDGKPVKGIKEINGSIYYFDKDYGDMQIGVIGGNGKYYLFGEDGARIEKVGWVKKYGEWYYINDDHTIVWDSWKKVNGKWYYFGGDRYMDSRYGKEWNKTISDSCMMTTPYCARNEKTGKYDWYYFNKDGTWYSKKGWKNFHGAWFYIKEDGTLATGWNKINGNWYFFRTLTDLEPIMLAGACSTAESYDEANAKVYLFDSDGKWVNSSGWHLVKGAIESYINKINNNEQWYYLDGNSIPKEGWQSIGGKWYYFNKDTKVMETGVAKALSDSGENKLYYFNDSGALQSNSGWHSWKTEDGIKWCYLDGYGYAETGWKKLCGKWYYLKDGVMVTGKEIINNKVEKFSDSGEWLGTTNKGWESFKYNISEYSDLYSREKWVYVSDNGKIVKDRWEYINGRWYHFDTQGDMETGVTEIISGGKSKFYYLDENGAWNGNKGWKSWKIDNNKVRSYVDENGYALIGYHEIDGKYYYFNEYSGILED